jgi:hypothetical protein
MCGRSRPCQTPRALVNPPFSFYPTFKSVFRKLLATPGTGSIGSLTFELEEE